MIHLLDYKPQAAAIDPANQLLVYALALASRTRLPANLFRCAWFDERDYFEFFPLQALRAKPSRVFIEREGSGRLPYTHSERELITRNATEGLGICTPVSDLRFEKTIVSARKDSAGSVGTIE